MIVYILVILMIIQGARFIYHVETLGRKSNTTFYLKMLFIVACKAVHFGMVAIAL